LGLGELGAPCGLCCESCKFYITKNCRGCKAKRDEKCPIWKCAEQKGFRFCAECSSFPCEKNYTVPALAKQWLDEIKETFMKLENA
jgi:hypothetical protein